MRIKKVEVAKDGDITFMFEDSNNPFSVHEFRKNACTRKTLEEIEKLIIKKIMCCLEL